MSAFTFQEIWVFYSKLPTFIYQWMTLTSHFGETDLWSAKGRGVFNVERLILWLDFNATILAQIIIYKLKAPIGRFM